MQRLHDLELRLRRHLVPSEHGLHLARVRHHLPAGEPRVVRRRVGADPAGAVRRREHVLHGEELGVQGGDVEVLHQPAGDDVAGAGGEVRVGGRHRRQHVGVDGRLEPAGAVLDAAHDPVGGEGGEGVAEQRQVDEDVVVRLHDKLGLRAEDGAPLQAHHRLQREVPVRVLGNNSIET